VHKDVLTIEPGDLRVVIFTMAAPELPIP
jgi:hypothetical protein